MMRDDDKTIRQGDSNGSVGDRIGQLIRSAGPREAVAQDRMVRVRNSVHGAWHQAVAKPERRPLMPNLSLWFTVPVAATAAIVVAVTLGIWINMAGQPTSFGNIDVVRGQVTAFDAENRSVGDPTSVLLGAGYAVETGPNGRAALSLASGHSIRFDNDTRLVLASNDELILERGAIYLDSGLGARHESLRIDTPFGVARDVGTQYELRLLASAMRVRVREGLVKLDATSSVDDGEFDVAVGSELTLDGEGNSSQREIPVHGSIWGWTTELAPTFELEGRSLDDFLAWISRENGWKLVYSDPVIEMSAGGNVLHGSLDDLYAEEALEAVLLVTGIDFRLQDGVLTVGV